jgi:hypothetical protein
MSRAPPTVVHLPVLRPDRKTLARLTFRWMKPLDLNTCSAPTSLRRFYGATDKTKLAWFWGSNQETFTVILMVKSPNHSCQFWGPNRKTRATGFEAKPRETVDLGFETQPRNSRSSYPCAWCRPHTVSPDLLITRPLSTWTVFDHPQSTVPGFLLDPRRCSSYRTCHLHTTRQANMILHTN